MGRGVNISLHLVEGEDNKTIVAKYGDWGGTVLKIPREDVKSCDKVELTCTGVYFLFGKEVDGADYVYIGEAENVKERVIRHIQDFNKGEEKFKWSTVVACVGNDLNQAHIRFLEDYFVRVARESKRYKVLTQKTYTPNLSDAQKDTMSAFADKVSVLLKVLGYNVLVPVVEIPQSKELKKDTKSTDRTDKLDIIVDKMATIVDRIDSIVNKVSEREDRLSKIAEIAVAKVESVAKEDKPKPVQSDIINSDVANSDTITVEDDKTYKEIENIGRVILPEPQYLIKTADVKAYGRKVATDFVVLKGSTIRKDCAPSFWVSGRKILRDKLIEEGKIKNFVLTQDIVFHSPSGAASLVLGRDANGNIEWKTKDGKTYKEVEEEESSLITFIRVKGNNVEIEKKSLQLGSVEYYIRGYNGEVDAHCRRVIGEGKTTCLLLKGSKIKEACFPSYPKYSQRIRDVLSEEGKLKNFVTTENVIFLSPSGVATFVLGRTSDGNAELYSADGRRYRDIENTDKDD